MKLKVAAAVFLACSIFSGFSQAEKSQNIADSLCRNDCKPSSNEAPRRLSADEMSSMKKIIQHWSEAKAYCKIDDSLFESATFGYNPFSQNFEKNLKSDSKFMGVLKNVIKKELQKSDFEDFMIRLHQGDDQLASSLKKEFESHGGKFQPEYSLDVKSEATEKYYSDMKLRKVIIDSFYTQKKCNKETLESDRLQFKKDFQSLNQCKATFIQNSPFFRFDLVCDGVVHQDILADQSIWKKAL